MIGHCILSQKVYNLCILVDLQEQKHSFAGPSSDYLSFVQNTTYHLGLSYAVLNTFC